MFALRKILIFRHTESDKESFLATYFKATIDHVKRQYRMRRALMEMQDELIGKSFDLKINQSINRYI